MDRNTYLEQVKPLLEGVLPVFISEQKRADWGLEGEVIPPGIDVNQYGGYTGELKAVLRVGNRVMERDLMLGYREQVELCSGLPTTLLGDNPQLDDSHPSKSWDDLKNHLRKCRVYLNTTKEPYEDGYNLSMLEAMAAGMPVVSLANPSSPLTDGRDGFVSDDLAKLRRSLELLLSDQLLAKTMGEAARRTVAEKFPISKFISRWNAAIARACGGGAEARNRLSRASVWLDYAYYPATTAHYLRRAFEKNHHVVTSGASMPPEVLKMWNLENMKAPILNQDIPRAIARDASGILGQMPKGFAPDFFLWVESGLDGPPAGLEMLAIPKAAYFIDTHLHLESHINVARQFDVVFLAQREYIPAFKERGIANVHWLPLGCDPEIHGKRETAKRYDIGFAGSITPQHQRRAALLEKLQRRFNVKIERVFLEEMAELYSASKIVFNNAIRNDLNMRVFEALCSGSLLLTDTAEGLADFFEDRRHLVVYNDANVGELAAYYLQHEDERESIAENGRAAVLEKHTYAHRAEQIIATLRERRESVVLGDKPEHYFHNVRPEVVELVPSTVMRILEVGCAAGETGQALKRQNPAREVVGVEYNNKAAQKAAKLLDRVFAGDSERLELPYPEGYFDCIIYSDVLEHLRDPEALLKRHKRLLAPDGMMVMSIPNIQHISVLNQLMEGRFTYQDEGLLDRTHIHFFTLHEIREMLKRCGLIAALVQGKRADNVYQEGSKGILRIGRWQIDSLSESEMFNFFVFQYLIVAGHGQETLARDIAPFDPARFRALVAEDDFFRRDVDDPLVSAGAALLRTEEPEPDALYSMLDELKEIQPERKLRLAHLNMAVGRFGAARNLYREAESPKYEGCALAAGGLLGEGLKLWWAAREDAGARDWFGRYANADESAERLAINAAVEGNGAVIGAGEPLPAAEHTLDYLVLNHALDATGDIFEMVAQAKHVLKPDGLLLAVAYDAALAENELYPLPLHRFSPAGLEKMVKAAAGFSAALVELVPERCFAVAASENPAALERFAERVKRLIAQHAAELSRRYWDMKRYRAAGEAARLAVDHDGENAAALCKYADFLMRVNDAAKAGGLYEKAARLGAVEAANIGLGTIRLGKGDYGTAIGYYEKAVAANWKNDRALCGLGIALFHAGKQKEGIACYQKAIAANPENPIALSSLVQACYQTKDFALAEKSLTEYLELHPANLDLLFGLAGVYYQQGKYGEAREALDRILIFNPEHGDALMLLEQLEKNGTAI
ncbi:MAG: glycosyltransferase [Nitrospinae bacterium]|nr:glycosyltransferase [Nitrospinota bacterium]